MQNIIVPLVVAIYFFTLSGPGFAASQDERQVIATGVALSEEDAKRQAYRNAIQSVIGAMVVAETLVENDTVLRDKVLSHSDGYITKVEQVGATRTKEGGLFEVTMRVTVKSQQLREKLKTENITRAEVDGESLFVKKATQQEGKADAAQVVTEALKDLPAAVIKAEAHVDKAEMTANGNMTQIALPVDVYVDMDSYGSFARSLAAALEKLGFPRKTANLKFASSNQSVVSEFGMQKSLDLTHEQWKTVFVVALCEMIDIQGDTTRWSLFLPPKEVIASFEKNSTVKVKVELLDGSGMTVTSQEMQVGGKGNEDYANRGYNVIMADIGKKSGMALVLPRLTIADPWGTISKIEIGKPNTERFSTKVTFLVSDSELRAIKGVRCTVSNVPSAAAQ